MAKRINARWAEFLVVVGIAVVPPLLNLLRYAVGTLNDPQQASLEYCSVSFLYSFAVTASLYYGVRFIFSWLNKTRPWNQAGTSRILPQIVLVFGYSTVMQWIILLIFSSTNFYSEGELTASFLFENIFFGNTITLIVIAIVEGVYLFRAWKYSLVQTEKLRSESLQSQIDSLKGQLDPHFMFNSLNVLSSLMEKDIRKAQWFIDDFARVYRYVLEVKDEMVVPLRQELQVLDSYLNLQKIRFDEGIAITRNIDPAHLGQYVPPLSVQELVSNAIKHNEASVLHPLQIEIKSVDDFLVVTNSLRFRQEKVASTGTGLDNLTQRYQLLSSQRPTFRILDDVYEARIPLIPSEK